MARGLFAGPARQEVSSRFVPIPFEDLAASAFIKQSRFDEASLTMSEIQKDLASQVVTSPMDQMIKHSKQQEVANLLGAEFGPGVDLGDPRVSRKLNQLIGQIKSDPFWTNVQMNEETARDYQKLLSEAYHRYPDKPWMFSEIEDLYGAYMTRGSQDMVLPKPSPNLPESVNVFTEIGNILSRLKPDTFTYNERTGLTSIIDTDITRAGLSKAKIYEALGISYTIAGRDAQGFPIVEPTGIYGNRLPSSVRGTQLGSEIMLEAAYRARQLGETDPGQIEGLAAALYFDKVIDYANSHEHRTFAVTEDIPRHRYDEMMAQRPQPYTYSEFTQMGIPMEEQRDLQDIFDVTKTGGSKLTRWLAGSVGGDQIGSQVDNLLRKYGSYNAARDAFAEDATRDGGKLFQDLRKDLAKLTFDLEAFFSNANTAMSPESREMVTNVTEKIKQEEGVDITDRSMSPRERMKVLERNIKDFNSKYRGVHKRHYTDIKYDIQHTQDMAWRYIGVEPGEETAVLSGEDRGRMSMYAEIFDTKGIRVDPNSKELFGRKGTGTVHARYQGQADPNNSIAPSLHIITLNGKDYFVPGVETEQIELYIPHALTGYDRSYTGVGDKFLTNVGGRTYTVQPARNYSTGALEVRILDNNGSVIARHSSMISIEDAYRQFEMSVMAR